MSNKNLLDVIEGMLDEGINDHINKITNDNIKDGKNFGGDHRSADTQGVLGTTSGQALDAGGDKDVGHSGHGKHGSEASADTQGVEGTTSGQAQDAGGDTDVGGSKGDNASDASADTQGVEGKTSGQALDAGGDKDVGKMRKEDITLEDLESMSEEDYSAFMESLSDEEMEAVEEAIVAAYGDVIAEESDEDEDEEDDEEDEDKDSCDEEFVTEEEDDGDASKAIGVTPKHKRDPKATAAKPAAPDSAAAARRKAIEAHQARRAAKKDAYESVEVEGEEIEEKLHGDQHKLDHNHNGKIDSSDMKDVRKKGATAHLTKEEAEEIEEKDSNMYGDKSSADTQGILGKKKGQALDAGGDKDVGKLKEEEELVTEDDVPGSDEATYKPKPAKTGDTQGVLGKKAGQPLDAGGDKDVGKLKEESEDSISEEYKQRAEVIFEAAVGEKLSMLREEMEVEFDKQLTEEKARLNELATEYIEEAVGEWLQENALEVRYSLRTEISENFIRGLKSLFQESYIEIPDDEVGVVDELTEAVEEQRTMIEDMEQELAEARSFILESKKAEVLGSLCEDLTQTQAVRLEKLAEGLEAADIEEFSSKVTALKEGYFDEASSMPMIGSLAEEVLEPSDTYLQENMSDAMSMYTSFLGKTVQK